jgi:predicted TIM-barrel fold metal-dependent hydrolase
LPYRVALAGEDKFFIGSDFPYGEGFVNPIVNTREALARLPEQSVNNVRGENAAKFLGV